MSAKRKRVLAGSIPRESNAPTDGASGGTPFKGIISGKAELTEAVRKENQDIEDFFKNSAKPKKKKRQLAVPANEPTPAVKEMQMLGAGYVSNSYTHTAKKVTRGKNATKGRGTVQEEPIAPFTGAGGKRTQQLPIEKIRNLPKFNYDDGDEGDEPSPMLEDEELLDENEFPDIHGDVDDDNEYVDDDDSNHDGEDKRVPDGKGATAPQDTISIFDDGLPIGKPIYTNDTWAFGAVKKFQKDLKMKQKVVPAFYLRRERTPEEIPFQGSSGGDNMGPRCKILTFHSDGSFKWPMSSSHLCWNCCCAFEGPPAMIPRYFNPNNKFYEIYGNFCNWSCAKRYSIQQHNEYSCEVSPSLDLFAKKYFGVALPIPIAPPRILLDSFSDFGMTIEEYRENSKATCSENYQILQPPCVPYELLVIWDAKNPKKKRLPTYSKVISNRFEGQMSGSVPMPTMPAGISQPQFSMSVNPIGGSVTTIKSQKKKPTNLLSLLGGT